MRKYKIPASITLAQGLLESGAGEGELARRSNNHFGIKRGSDWTGPTVTHDDDRNGEHFRVYKSVADSYEDHSKFLQKPRYQRLFRLSISDYKGWARGLKSCGYATNPLYADRLISLIELYDLDKLDEKSGHYRIPAELKHEEVKFVAHPITHNNGVCCIIAQEGDTWESLAHEKRMSKRKLLDYNEAIESVRLYPGDFVYVERKAKKGPKSMKGKWHKLTMGESMHSVSQLYGIRLEKLYKLNFKSPDYQPMPGDLLRVR